MPIPNEYIRLFRLITMLENPAEDTLKLNIMSISYKTEMCISLYDFCSLKQYLMLIPITVKIFTPPLHIG